MFLHQQDHNNDLGLTLSLGGGAGGGGPSSSKPGPTTTMTTTNAEAIPFKFNMMMDYSSPSHIGGGTGGGGPSSSKPGPTTTMITTNAEAIPFKFNMMMDYHSSPSHIGLVQKLPWNTTINSFPTSSPSDVTYLKGIDVNRAARVDEEEEEGGVSSPNSTVSTVSGGKRGGGGAERDQSATTTVGPAAGDELNEVERTLSSRGGMTNTMSDEEDDGSENSRKKLRLTKDQSAVLEDSFKEHNTLNPKQKLALAKRLGLRPRQVEVWFQNRRARTKLKQTEVDCEFLKRCCEQLTEENRRLQKEVAELRTLKLSPQFYMQMTPPTTLTMCPSCERVGVPPFAPPQPGPARHRVPIRPA